MRTLVRLVLFSLLLPVVLLVVDSSPVHAQSEAEAVGSAAAPAASTTFVQGAPPKYADASIGFEFEYKVDNAAVCVAWPEQLQDSGCDGLAYDHLVEYAVEYTGAKDPSLQSIAILRFDNNNTATIDVVHKPSTKTFISQVEIDALLDGILGGLQAIVPAPLTMSGSAVGSRYDVTEINGVDTVRYELTADVRRGAPGYFRSRGVGYVLFGKHGQIMITTWTDPRYIRQTRVALESIVKTVRLPRLEQKEPPLPQKEPPLPQKGVVKTAWWVRVLDSNLSPFLLVLVVVGLLSVYEHLARKERKRRSKQR